MKTSEQFENVLKMNIVGTHKERKKKVYLFLKHQKMLKQDQAKLKQEQMDIKRSNQKYKFNHGNYKLNKGVNLQTAKYNLKTLGIIYKTNIRSL